MKWLLKYSVSSLIKILVIFVSFYVFQNDILAVSVSNMKSGLNPYSPIPETYTTEIESSFWLKEGHGGGVSWAILKSEAGSECKNLLSIERSAAKASRGLWTLTKEGALAIKNHKTFGTIYKSSSDGLWWAVDKAGHGGSKFKVFKETNKGLEWFKDADEFGDFITNKHKGSTGAFIPWGQLGTVK